MGRVTYLYYLPRRNRYLAGRIIAADNAPTPSMLIVSYNNTVREKICHIFQFRHNSLYISKIKAGRQLENRVIYQPIPQP